MSQHLARAGVADLDLLAAAAVAPVDEVQLKIVRLAVGQVDIDGEIGGGVPDGGDPVRRAGDRTCASPTRLWSRYKSSVRWGWMRSPAGRLSTSTMS